jgi:hypothetical protein
MLVNTFDTLAQRITEEFREAVKHEIRRYKWIEKGRGRDLSWEEAWNEWALAHRENLGQFLMAELREAYSPAQECAPQESRTTSLQSSRMSRVGMSGMATRSSIAAAAATPISRHGW